MINLPILPILICLPLIGLLFILLSSENDEYSIQSKKSAIWTSFSNFLLSLYLPLNFNKEIPHFQFVNSFNWFNSDSLKFTLGVDGISMPFIVLSTFLILLCVIYIYPQKKKKYEDVSCFIYYAGIFFNWYIQRYRSVFVLYFF